MTRRRVLEPAQTERPPGWYTEPVRAWFGPSWEPATRWGGNDVQLSDRARQARETRVAQGDGGGIAGLSQRNDARLAEIAHKPVRADYKRKGRRVDTS